MPVCRSGAPIVLVVDDAPGSSVAVACAPPTIAREVIVLRPPPGRTVVWTTSSETCLPPGVMVVTTVRPRASVAVRMAPSVASENTIWSPYWSVVVSMLPEEPLLELSSTCEVWSGAGAEVMMLPPRPTATFATGDVVTTTDPWSLVKEITAPATREEVVKVLP